MKNIKIITDSTSDIPKGIAEKYDIEVLPLTIFFDKDELRDWIDIAPKAFYERMKKSEKLPTTSQVNPNSFKEKYEKFLQSHDHIISLHLSSDASGTYSSAVIARDMVDKGRITVIDTRNFTYGFGQMVVEAAKMAQEGKTVVEIVDRINYMISNVKTLFVVDSLEYLKKGGRLSSTKVTIGTLLNLKPILTLENGKIVAIDKARGMKKALRRIVELMQEQGVDLMDQIIKVGYADNIEHLKEFETVIEEVYGKVEKEEFEIGCVTGVYCGPGTVIIHYI
ncbi:DegV family protein [Lutispora thermophila]|uniref:EDD domain protein, DegV family n=1 Tax=Lutispora thermophila DSM 19022 TaxID=1122184 RepID=A0A1M6IZE1_9FIRM|nr:DegV family protein [Lutispora thermophila]SHJ39763.1 EDD domain protein, DegV family [Lutispora thermophila DSM 19022]